MDTMTTPVGVSEHGDACVEPLSERSDFELLALVATDGDGTSAIETLFLRHLAFARRFVQRCEGVPDGLDADTVVTDAFGQLFLAVRAGNGPTTAIAPAVAQIISQRLGVVPPEVSSRPFLKLDDDHRAALLVCAFTGGEPTELVPAVATDERAASQLLDRAIAQLRTGRAPAAALVRQRLAAGTLAILLLGCAGGAWALSRATNSIDVFVPAPPATSSGTLLTAPSRNAAGTVAKATSTTAQAGGRTTSPVAPGRSDTPQAQASSTTTSDSTVALEASPSNPASAATSPTQPSTNTATTATRTTAATTSSGSGTAPTSPAATPLPTQPATTAAPTSVAPTTAPTTTRAATTTPQAPTTTAKPTTTTTTQPTTTSTQPPPTTTRAVSTTSTTLRDAGGPRSPWQPPGAPGDVPDTDVTEPTEDDT